MTLTQDVQMVKILVVDDEPLMKSLILQSFKDQISAEEIDFQFALNGEEALKIVNENHDIGIVLTDIVMPEMDGLTLLGHLSKLNRAFRTIVISAYGDMKNIRTAMNRGASEFITKPIDLQDLKDTVAKTISEYHELKKGVTARERVIELNKELKIAHEIQQSFIPVNFDVVFSERNPVDLIGEMIPAKEIGGDFFDFIKLDNHRLAFFIADVSGKGIPAALLMSRCSVLMHGVALAANQSCVECMLAVNKTLCDKNDACMFVTAFYGILNVNTGDLNYCNAGHNPPILFGDNKCVFIGINQGIALGVDMEHEELFTEHSIKLNKNDLIVLYTDGVTEAGYSDNKKEFYTEERLKNVIEKYGDDPLSDILKAIKDDVTAFIGNSPQRDDITIFLIRYLGNSNDDSTTQLQ
ncbi:MAG: SpoIIE family protein phosphatase [Chlamydiales bacterium]|nr:SpoIIE family protein phosphatase [Chlamydiales bacterium]